MRRVFVSLALPLGKGDHNNSFVLLLERNSIFGELQRTRTVEFPISNRTQIDNSEENAKIVVKSSTVSSIWEKHLSLRILLFHHDQIAKTTGTSNSVTKQNVRKINN